MCHHHKVISIYLSIYYLLPIYHQIIDRKDSLLLTYMSSLLLWKQTNQKEKNRETLEKLVVKYHCKHLLKKGTVFYRWL